MNEYYPAKGFGEMEKTQLYITLPEAIGSIEATSDQQERLNEFTERVASGEFHVDADGTIPAECVDERDGDPRMYPNVVGGTATVMVADDLTTRRFAGEDNSTVAAMRNTAEYVYDTGHPVGDHVGDHRNSEKTDCGGLDKMHLGYQFISSHGDELRRLTESLGLEVSDEVHNDIVANAAGREEFSASPDVLEQITAVSGSESAPSVHGDHRGVVAVINARYGTTLDRGLLAKEFGGTYQAFNVDSWSFSELAKLTSVTPEEQQSKTIAAAYYNLAIGHVLWGKNMRVVVLE